MSIARFSEFLEYEKRLSPHTVIAYSNDLTQCELYLQQECDIKSLQEAGYQYIRSWIASLMENKISPRTVNRKITALKTYFKFLLREGTIKENPMLKIQGPKTAKRLPVFVEKKQMDMLLDFSEMPDDYTGIRDRLMIEIFYATGIRLSELINLKESDIDHYHSTIKVLGKRNKERIIPVSNGLLKLIAKYRDKKANEGLRNDDGWLLLTDKGGKMYPKLIYRKVNEYLGAVTTLSKKSPHVLRHTFATHMLNNGAELNAIKELLGHANLAATQVYTHNSMEKLKNIHKQAHPRA